jgi:lysophospholipase
MHVSVGAKAGRMDSDVLVDAKILMIYTGGTIGMCAEKDMGYVPIPGFLFQTISKNPKFNDPLFQLESGSTIVHSNFKDQSLVLPPSYYGKRALVSVLEYNPLMDSSNMSIEDWIRIASDIELYYYDFDAFVVLHGTDTMAYTASALSFMLENLGKSVILTGSQIPLSEIRNDGSTNLLGALTIATHHIIPEVTLYFANALYRGNRVVKSKSSSFDAFESPNMKPLAVVGIDIGTSRKCSGPAVLCRCRLELGVAVS